MSVCYGFRAQQESVGLSSLFLELSCLLSLLVSRSAVRDNTASLGLQQTVEAERQGDGWSYENRA